MGNVRRKFTAEFRDEAVKLALRDGSASTARALGLGQSTLHKWLTEYRRQNNPEPSGELNFFQLQEELRQLKEQNRRLQMERDILKKATAFFANENK